MINKLFSTEFEVFQGLRGMDQTTKGVYLCYNRTNKHIVLDLEGTDSKQRSDESRNSFENKSCLFALAVSQILMVNINIQELGRVVGSMSEILLTIFEANFRIFDEKKKKKILFVIRDYDRSRYPFNVREIIIIDIKREWEKIQIKNKMKFEFEDFFYFDYFLIAHPYIKDEFDANVKELEDRFLMESREDCYWKDSTSDVPLCKIPSFFENIWGLIDKEMNVDMPSQKDIIACQRCVENKEIVKEKFYAFYHQIRTNCEHKFQNLLENDFVLAIQDNVNACVLEYEEKSRFYSQKHFYKNKQELLEYLEKKKLKLFKTFVMNLRKFLKKQFRKEVQKL